MGFNVAGGVTGSLQEVETATLAGRTTARYADPGALGHYLLNVDNGGSAMAAGSSANAPIFAWRWGNANISAVYGIRMGVIGTTTAFTAGKMQFDAMKVGGASFTASYTGGTGITLTGNNAKKRQSFGTTLVTDARISATAVLVSGGGSTLDANPFGKIIAPASTVINVQFVPSNTLLFCGRDNSDQAPMIFAQNEGFVIQSTVPATGTWFFQVSVDWLEVSAY